MGSGAGVELVTPSGNRSLKQFMIGLTARQGYGQSGKDSCISCDTGTHGMRGPVTI